jgi:quercetin dioxygenase-like cupin family protein
MKLKSIYIVLLSLFTTNLYSHVTPDAVIEHKGLKKFNMNGNSIKGLSTKFHGAKEFEVWKSQMGPGKSTPLHKHSSEEVFIILKGRVEVKVGDKVSIAQAPATIIAPANINHQIKNIGKTPTEQIVILGIDSKVWNSKGEELNLPWRK